MYSIMFNHKGQWLHNYNADYIPPITIGTTIDILDLHYEVIRIIFQPEQKRFKVFMEKI